METGLVFDIKRYSIHDGPGIRTTVFLKGCPLACWWCHNPEGRSPVPQVIHRPERCVGCGTCASVCPEGLIVPPEGNSPALAGEPCGCTGCGACAEACPAEARQLAGARMRVDEVVAAVSDDLLFFDESGGGVTFSGGEPLAQADFLCELLGRFGDLDVHRTVDTSGAASEETLRRVARETDLFLYDLKVMDEDRHRLYTGSSNRPILRNLEQLANSGATIWIRVPLVPGLTDDRDNIEHVGAFVRSLPGVEQVQLLPFHRFAKDKYRQLSMPDRLDEVAKPAEERAAVSARILEDLGLSVRIGG